MHDKALTPLLIFSLAFNIAFVGIWVYNRARPVPAPPGRPPWQALRLDPEQQRKLQEGTHELTRKAAELRAEAQRQRERLLDLMAADQPDEQAIRECEEHIRAAQKQLHQMVLEHMHRTRQLLGPEPRREWFRMMRARAERRGRGRRRLGPRPPQGQGPVPGLRPGPPGPTREFRERENP